MDRYRDLYLELFGYREEAGSRWMRTRVRSSPAGDQRIADAVELALPKDFSAALRRLEERELAPDELISFGEQLAELLLPPPARDLFRRSLDRLSAGEGLRLRIRADTWELAELPWEYVYVPSRGTPAEQKGMDGFLALDRRLSIVRDEAHPESGTAIEPLRRQEIRLVALLAEVKDPAWRPLALEREESNLRRSVEEIADIACEFYRPGTVSQLEQALDREVQVFHFAGHGEFARTMGERLGSVEGRGHVILADDEGHPVPFDAERLGQNLRARGVRLAVLGACETARRDAVNAWTGIAPALVRQGIAAVIGMQYSVLDEHAVAFSQRLYKVLAEGKSLDTATSEGRLAMSNRAKDGDRDFGVPVLYLRGQQSILFPPPPGRLRCNLVMLVTVLVLLLHGFYLHVEPVVERTLNLWVAWVGVGLPAVGAFLGASKMLASLLPRPISRERAPLIERLLRRRVATWLLAPVVAATVLLWASTTSLYVGIEKGAVDAVHVKLLDQSGAPLEQRPEIFADRPPALAGGPFFLLWSPIEIRAVSPPGWEPREPRRLLRPWRRIYLSFPGDFVERELRLVLIAPDAGLMSVLADDGDENPRWRFTLRATIGGKELELADVRRGLIGLGADEALLRARLDRLASEEVYALLRRECLRGADNPPLRDAWNAGLTLLPSPELPPGEPLQLDLALRADSAVLSSLIIDGADLSPGVNPVCLGLQRPPVEN